MHVPSPMTCPAAGTRVLVARRSCHTCAQTLYVMSKHESEKRLRALVREHTLANIKDVSSRVKTETPRDR